ncbi:MAG: YicC family protein [Myxococcales bacterium]|nr:YicC family protein [Myxococcales bacterium]
MKSMTGFGVGGAPLGDGRLGFEIRSLNHRFLDVRVRLPTEIVDHTFFVEQLARDKLSRGRYDIGVRLEGSALPVASLDKDRVRAAYRELSQLRDELAPGTDLPLTAALALPNVASAPPTVDPELLREALSAGFGAALVELDHMREKEGAALCRELRERLEKLQAIARAVSERGPELLRHHHARIRTRVERLIADAGVSVDTGRLEAELAMMADKSDITEELVRLESHAAQARSLLTSKEPVGRRFDFLLQEMGREVNTVGSKSQDSVVAQQVVELKSELERMREQVQNVE